jgi:formate dehydrogenase assembly factor FdhD
MRIVITLLCFFLGFFFSEAYVTGPKKHYNSGFKDAYDIMVKEAQKGNNYKIDMENKKVIFHSEISIDIEKHLK